MHAFLLDCRETQADGSLHCVSTWFSLAEEEKAYIAFHLARHHWQHVTLHWTERPLPRKGHRYGLASGGRWPLT